MTTAADLSGSSVAWWKEPTKEQWLAWVAAWLGWTLDAFDFTMFLLIMVPISQEFHVPLTDVAFVLSVTLWLRLVGAVGSGWLADRVGRKIPLMISILWYSLSNFAAGFSPTFTYLFLFRALLGIGMGRRMAGRWRTRDGDVAGTFARLHGRRPARLMGTWLHAVERRLWLVLCLYRLARHAVDRRFARAFRFLCTQIRQGAADLAGESAAAAP
jgi:Major Facilitator Superfamily